MRSEIWTLEIALPKQAYALLEELQATGLFGTTIENVAEQLIREKLRELVLEGFWCGENVARSRGAD